MSKEVIVTRPQNAAPHIPLVFVRGQSNSTNVFELVSTDAMQAYYYSLQAKPRQETRAAPNFCKTCKVLLAFAVFLLIATICNAVCILD